VLDVHLSTAGRPWSRVSASHRATRSAAPGGAYSGIAIRTAPSLLAATVRRMNTAYFSEAGRSSSLDCVNQRSTGIPSFACTSALLAATPGTGAHSPKGRPRSPKPASRKRW
jgi:hypothetical protein